ncbi:hypothetical protein TNCV_4590041 [Trichonephila clavipes]|nr:hypothetical protein TNCV_4590041 [Trichonephila clavipes]
MNDLSSSSFLPTDIGRVDSAERRSPGAGTSQQFWWIMERLSKEQKQRKRKKENQGKILIEPGMIKIEGEGVLKMGGA